MSNCRIAHQLYQTVMPKPSRVKVSNTPVVPNHDPTHLSNCKKPCTTHQLYQNQCRVRTVATCIKLSYNTPVASKLSYNRPAASMLSYNTPVASVCRNQCSPHTPHPPTHPTHPRKSHSTSPTNERKKENTENKIKAPPTT